MRECKRFYINGEWIEPVFPNVLDVVDPATEEVCGVISLGTEADVDKAVDAAKSAFETFSETDRKERIDLLNAVAAAYKRRIPDIGEAICEEMGAPKSLAQVGQAASGYSHFVEAARALKGYVFEEQVDEHRIVKEPIGVCGLITPWNWPMNQVACKVAPALAAGCTMVLKPSELAPLSAYIFAEIMHEACVPAGVFNMVNGEGPTVGAALSRHPNVDMVSFTGSTRAGTLVAQNAASTVKRVTQELGGKSPNIILDNADLESAVNQGMDMVLLNTGQSCNAPSRMLVPRAMLAEAEGIAARRVIEKVVIGPSDDDMTTMGPVVSSAQWDKVQNLINKGIEEGARVVCGGLGLPEGIAKGYYIRPTVFTDVSNSMTIAREEIFGPVLAMIPYDSEEEAIRIANDTLYGLAAYIASTDIKRARNLAAKLRVGNVHINGVWAGAAVPFGGFKQSGNGRERGAYGFADYLEIKVIEGYGVD